MLLGGGAFNDGADWGEVEVICWVDEFATALVGTGRCADGVEGLATGPSAVGIGITASSPRVEGRLGLS